jgi:hypothetical protein
MSDKNATLKSFFSKSFTCSDIARPFSEVDIPFFEGNFHIYTFDCYYGDGSVMSAIGRTNAVVTFPKGNLKDIFFTNYTPGSNSVIVFVGTVPNWYTEQHTKY